MWSLITQDREDLKMKKLSTKWPLRLTAICLALPGMYLLFAVSYQTFNSVQFASRLVGGLGWIPLCQNR